MLANANIKRGALQASQYIQGKGHVEAWGTKLLEARRI